MYAVDATDDELKSEHSEYSALKESKDKNPKIDNANGTHRLSSI